MATINSATTRGRVSRISGLTPSPVVDGYLSVRDATNGTNISVNTNDTVAIQAATTSTGGGYRYTCSRYFMAFDTTSITATPGSATLYIYGNINISSDLIVVKSTAPTTTTNIATTNFSSISGYSATNPMLGFVTEYSSSATFTTGSGWNTIPLNSTALSDMNTLTTFQIAIVNYTYDYLYFDPNTTFNVSTGINITNQPYILYTGFNGKVYSIPITSVNAVDGVLSGNISKINT